MHLDDYNFELPSEQIAQYPLPNREDSRLMVLDRGAGTVRSGKFIEIVDYFRSGDVLVVNDTRVIPARLLGVKASGGKIEVFLVERLAGADEVWRCLTRCSKKPKPGQRLHFPGGIVGEVVEGGHDLFRTIRFFCQRDFMTVLEEVGRIPLPPYIRRDDDATDRERYQTVYASAPGAVAAPTAGLHFTPQLFETLRTMDVRVAPVTLHVGLGTFLPVRAENILQHRMHSENYLIPESSAAEINRAKEEGRRVVALGTTSTRALESAAGSDGVLRAGPGNSELFICPGYSFQIVDALITNFHLPRSTLLMLVSAFAGKEFVLSAYRRAQAEGFRFFSYGDCMLIV